MAAGGIVAAGLLAIAVAGRLFPADPPPAVLPRPQDDEPLFRVEPRASTLDPAAGRAVTLKDVNDGDTITLSDDTVVRYLGINTPEFMRIEGGAWVEDPEAFGRDARARNDRLVRAGDLRIFPIERTTHDRTLASILVVAEDQRIDVVEQLLREGLGWLDDTDLDAGLRQRYVEAQVEAIDAKRGLWEHVAAREGEVHASKSGIFHVPGCGHNLKSFTAHASALEAFRAGLRPPYQGRPVSPPCWSLGKP